MDLKLPFILLVIGVGVAGATPFGIAQLGFEPEPAMEIDMVSGQTQNPFRIQDYQDVDVFTVDIDGHVTPDQDGMLDFHYKSGKGEIINLVDTDFANAVVLAEWTWAWDEIYGNQWIHRFDHAIVNSAQRVSGLNICSFASQTYDGADWNNFLFTTLSGASYSDEGSDTNGQPTTGVFGVRYVLYISGDGSGECNFKNIGSIYEFLELPDITVTRNV